MTRNWMRIVIAPFLLVALAACSPSAEDQTGEGIKAQKKYSKMNLLTLMNK